MQPEREYTWMGWMMLTKYQMVQINPKMKRKWAGWTPLKKKGVDGLHG
jgi:hypothetical protein